MFNVVSFVSVVVWAWCFFFCNVVCKSYVCCGSGVGRSCVGVGDKHAPCGTPLASEKCSPV